MKIVRVVHDDIIQDIEIEQRLMLLESYDTEKFISEHSDDIVANVAKLEENLLADVAIAVAPLLFQINQIAKREAVKQAHILEIKAAIALTLSTVLQDLLSQSLDNMEVVSLELAKQKYPRTHNLSIGTYTLHPYDSGRLARLEHYHKNLALEKDNELIVLLGKMGAKTVRIVETDSQQKSGAFQAGVETVAVDTEGSLSLAQRIEQGKELLVVFEGNVIEVDPNLLKSSLWFANDGQLNAIFESRRFTPNKIQEYTLRNTYTETFDFNFDLAVKYLVVKADLKAEYKTISEKERFFHVEFG
jgi:hypothetical protein